LLDSLEQRWSGYEYWRTKSNYSPWAGNLGGDDYLRGWERDNNEISALTQESSRARQTQNNQQFLAVCALISHKLPNLPLVCYVFHFFVCKGT